MDVQLTKSELTILKYLNSHGGFVSGIGKATTTKALSVKLDYSPYTTDDYLKKLESLSLVEARLDYDSSETYYTITTEGKTYLELRKERNFQKIIWSVLVPIAISVATNLLFNLLT